MTRFLRRRYGLAALSTLLFALLPFAMAGSAQAVTLPPHGQIYNNDSPRCLDSGTPNGVLLFNCTTSIYQQWSYNRLGEIVGNSPTGCLDDGAGVNGTRVILATCTGSTRQQWTIDPFGGEFINVASGKCLDADLGTIGGQGTIVQVWSCAGAANQIWSFQFPDSTFPPPPPDTP
ncbi:MAG TPA: RICIN domain-containing protein [Streptosporangiaceae bacterium]|nr:RICIN domain-containing protein [Streptosporangiaceae bacterium]